MEPSLGPYSGCSTSATCSAFASAPHRLRGLVVGGELKTRPRHLHRRSRAASSGAGFRGEGVGHEGGSCSDDHGGRNQPEVKAPLPPPGWTARMGNTSRKLKQVNVRSDVLMFNESASVWDRVFRTLKYCRQHEFRKKVRVKKPSKRTIRSVRYNAFIRSAKELGPRGQWQEVLRLLDKLAEDGIPLNSYTYNSAMSSIAKTGRWREALGLRDRMLAEGIKLDGYSFNALIEACSKGGQVKKGLELLREMVDAGVPRDCFSYNAALHGFVQLGDSENALKMLQDMVADGVRPDLVSYSTVLACCGKGGEWERCMNLMDQMRSEGIAPNVYSFSSLINACGKAGRWALAVKTLEDMEASGLRPNEHNWLTAIGACGNAGRWQEALQLIDKLEVVALEGRGLPMSTTLYNFAIDACARAGRWDQGVLLLERMKNNPATPPDARTYSCLINACAKDANLEDALAYLTEMRAVGLAPTIFAYVSAMNAAKMAGRWQEALGLLNEMDDAGLIPDVLSFINVVDAFGKDGQLALSLVQPALDDSAEDTGDGGQKTADPSDEARSHVDLNAWMFEEPSELVKWMEKKGIRPDVISFNVLIDACARGGRHWNASKLLEEMKSRGLRPNAVSYNSVIHACRAAMGDEWQIALDLLDSMRRSGLTPDAFAFNTAIMACVKAGDWRRALDLLAGMKVEGITPDILSHNSVISACAKGGQWRIGLELLAKIRADPTLEPNQRTYTAVINCFQQFQGGQAVASLASTLAEFSSREEMLLNPMPTSDVHLGGVSYLEEGGGVEEA